MEKTCVFCGSSGADDTILKFWFCCKLVQNPDLSELSLTKHSVSCLANIYKIYLISAFVQLSNGPELLILIINIVVMVEPRTDKILLSLKSWETRLTLWYIVFGTYDDFWINPSRFLLLSAFHSL